tara:strand:- start:2560 stop:3267 length:708 start_codon:yes stop_codon:yes gene_type:complete
MNSTSITSHTIPKVIIQTYSNKTKVPQKVFENIQKFAPGFKHIIFDDNECIQFLRDTYSEHFVTIFNSFPRGAHKSDFFRYCYLYIHGGYYLDIKIELIKNLNEIVMNDTFLYTVLSFNKNSLFQGILFCPPKLEIMKKAFNNMVETSTKQKNYQYNYFTIKLYDFVKTDVGTLELQPGLNEGKQYSYYLFKEECSQNASDCYDGLDRHGLCCFSYNHQKEKNFKNRYADFGRRW